MMILKRTGLIKKALSLALFAALLFPQAALTAVLAANEGRTYSLPSVTTAEDFTANLSEMARNGRLARNDSLRSQA
ncbi:hypothetical protein, partial [Vibrio parahaemolyticus]|uniref:hypothetical protein n=1 Tax=Vibrio parahaemolyticus TaxID=670 RepID=UPI001A8DC72C